MIHFADARQYLLSSKYYTTPYNTCTTKKVILFIYYRIYGYLFFRSPPYNYILLEYFVMHATVERFLDLEAQVDEEEEEEVQSEDEMSKPFLTESSPLPLTPIFRRFYHQPRPPRGRQR
jgi:hypothetical protein